MAAECRLPDTLVACIGGGSNAIGLFHPFLDDADVAMHAVEAAGLGLNTKKHAASLTGGRPGVCTATAPTCCRTTTARSPSRIRSRPASTIPGSGRSMPGCTTWAG